MLGVLPEVVDPFAADRRLETWRGGFRIIDQVLEGIRRADVQAYSPEELARGLGARGFAVGVAAHGIGTARAFQVNETAGAFAGIGMGLNAMLTAVIAPLLVALLLLAAGVLVGGGAALPRGGLRVPLALYTALMALSGRYGFVIAPAA